MNTKSLPIQERLCTSTKLECVDKIKVNTSICMKPCSGLIVTGVSKYELKENNVEEIKTVFSSVFEDYNKYKKIQNAFAHPPENGNIVNNNTIVQMIDNFLNVFRSRKFKFCKV